jgi:hypothetical protein
MNFVLGVAAKTPLWAWLLLSYLVWQGIKAMQPRTTTIWQALIVPAIFIIWGLSRIVLSRQQTFWLVVAWAAAALVLFSVRVLTRQSFEIDRARGLILRQGSVIPLVRNLVVFFLQYAVAVLASMHADDHAIGALIGRAISGATSGYFIGSAISLLREYRRKRFSSAT